VLFLERYRICKKRLKRKSKAIENDWREVTVMELRSKKQKFWNLKNHRKILDLHFESALRRQNGHCRIELEVE
jgi:hypothetical protein